MLCFNSLFEWVQPSRVVNALNNYNVMMKYHLAFGDEPVGEPTLHTITFFPLGNADSFRIDLESGKKLLFDYGNEGDPNDKSDKRIDLAKALREDLELAGRNNFDVVAFTHLDRDHVCRASELFYLDHAPKYQNKERIKIDTLWVPAAALLEESLDEDAKIIQAEARYRLKQKQGVRVFSRPDRLREWLEKQNISFGEVGHLITDAGNIAPDFSRASDAVEFFVHSPFAEHAEDGALLDRNDCSLVMQAAFYLEMAQVNFILSADTAHELWTSIVKQTRWHKNEERLLWDIFKLPHHCSYKSLGPDKGTHNTVPAPSVEWLFETQGNGGCIVVATSKPIPSDDSDDQPPHRQAANYYRALVKVKGGEFKVTMEHPLESRPEPLVIEIGGSGAKVKKTNFGSAAVITGRPAPRAGWR